MLADSVIHEPWGRGRQGVWQRPPVYAESLSVGQRQQMRIQRLYVFFTRGNL